MRPLQAGREPPASIVCARGGGWCESEQGHISALCHLSHSRGKPAVGSMVLPLEVVAGPGLRGAVGVQPVRLEGWKRLESPFFGPVKSLVAKSYENARK